MNKRLTLIIAGVLALLAIFLVKIYLDQRDRYFEMQAEKKAQQERENQITILLAKRDISVGESLDPSMIDVAVAPVSRVPPQTATSFDQIFRTEAVVPIAKGEAINLSKLTASRRASMARTAISLSTTTPEGKRAITIPVDQIASVGGMINPGDYVDVLCSLSVPVESDDRKSKKKEVILPLLQNVLVLAVGTELAGQEEYVPQPGEAAKQERKIPAKMITLALAPEEANILAFVQEQGKIQMILRFPGDSQTLQLKPASWETIFQYFLPQDQAPQKEQPVFMEQEKVKAGEVEYYRGLDKEMLPIYSK